MYRSKMLSPTIPTHQLYPSTQKCTTVSNPTTTTSTFPETVTLPVSILIYLAAHLLWATPRPYLDKVSNIFVDSIFLTICWFSFQVTFRWVMDLGTCIRATCCKATAAITHPRAVPYPGKWWDRRLTRNPTRSLTAMYMLGKEIKKDFSIATWCILLEMAAIYTAIWEATQMPMLMEVISSVCSSISTVYS